MVRAEDTELRDRINEAITQVVDDGRGEAAVAEHLGPGGYDARAPEIWE